MAHAATPEPTTSHPVDTAATDPAATDPAATDPDMTDGAASVPGGRLRAKLGPATWLRALALAAAVAFLAASLGWLYGARDPLNEVDVGFMQDMDQHHTQAIQMSLLLLGKDDVSPELKHYAQEIVMSQRYEQGLFNALLDRWNHPVDTGAEAMGWMGRPVPVEEMAGMATEEQVEELRDAEGAEAEALWIALITEHHLGGLHMADWAARHGQDATVRNIARSMVSMQRGEVIDLDRYRQANDLPIPEGFDDPLQDQRLNPISFTEE